MKYKPIKTKHGYYYTDPLPSEEDINKYYKEEFYQKPKPRINDSSLDVRDRDSEFYNFWYDFYLDLINDNKAETKLEALDLVDLGCGYGHFLKYAKMHNNFRTLKGVEPFPEFLDYVVSESIEGEVSTLENFSLLSKEKYNVVTMINVLEHLRKPESVLRNISGNLLVEGGVLLIQVPNDFNIIQKIAVEKNKNDNWWFCPPQHLSYFSPNSLENLLIDCGFSKIKCYCSFPIDMFLLMGKDYITKPELGREAHLSRLAFEKSFLKFGRLQELKRIYRSFARAEIGREIICIAKKR